MTGSEPDEKTRQASDSEVPLDIDLTSRILLAGHLFEQRLDHALNPEGLTARQYRALHHIALNPHVTRVELADVLHVSRQASGGISQRLANAGLIDRTHQGPGQSVSFAITESGRQHLRRASPIVTAAEQHILNNLPSTTAKSLVDAVDGLIDQMA